MVSDCLEIVNMYFLKSKNVFVIMQCVGRASSGNKGWHWADVSCLAGWRTSCSLSLAGRTLITPIDDLTDWMDDDEQVIFINGNNCQPEKFHYNMLQFSLYSWTAAVVQVCLKSSTSDMAWITITAHFRLWIQNTKYGVENDQDQVHLPEQQTDP